MELIVAKEEFSDTQKLKSKINYYEWVDFIDNNKYYFTWLEESTKGKNLIDNFDKIPEDFRNGIMKQLNKGQAFAEYNDKKDWYEMVIDYNPEYGFVRITLMKRINKKILEKLLEMTKCLDGYLLKNGKKF